MRGDISRPPREAKRRMAYQAKLTAPTQAGLERCSRINVAKSVYLVYIGMH
jgi:hypothetical protein